MFVEFPLDKEEWEIRVMILILYYTNEPVLFHSFWPFLFPDYHYVVPELMTLCSARNESKCNITHYQAKAGGVLAITKQFHFLDEQNNFHNSQLISCTFT